MASRRFVIYFLVATLVAVIATVIFEVYSFERAIIHSMGHEMLFARSVARFVRGTLDEEESHMRAVLEAMPPEPGSDSDAVREVIEHKVRSVLYEVPKIALLDTNARVFYQGKEAELPPPQVLLPSLRVAPAHKGLVVSDMWQDINGRPNVSFLLAYDVGEVPLVLIARIPIDDEAFLRLFRYFLVNAESRLQLLDGKGVALFSTQASERYQSVVHGTYLTDKVRAGKPTQMPCHSCHIKPDTGNGEKETRVVREDEFITLAPVPKTGWAITVRERKAQIFAPMKEMIYGSIILVSIIFGVFLGFFVLLSRRLLRPMRQLATAATTIARKSSEGAVRIDAQDELGLLAQSFEILRRMTEKQAVAVALPQTGSAGGSLSTVVEVEVPETPGFASRPTVAEALVGGSSFHTLLERTLDAVFDGLTSADLVCSAMIVLDDPRLDGSLVIGRGLDVENSAALATKLQGVSEGRSLVAIELLDRAEVRIGEAHGTRVFYVQDFHVLDSMRGQLWVGLSAGEEVARQLQLAMVLVVTQVQTLVERGLLHEQLRLEHWRKSQMLRHLFEAENDERKRIAREIHDETAQLLTALLLLLETFPDASMPSRQDETLDLAKARVGDILDGTHRLIRRLRPAVLDDLGLVEAVRAIGRNLLQPTGVTFELAVDVESIDLPKPIEDALFRVFQEAATNVVRHAGARHVRAGLEHDETHITAWFEDDGQGVDLGWLDDTTARPRWGMLGMRERITQIDGIIVFSTPERGGLRIEITVPIPSTEDSTRGGTHGTSAYHPS